MERSWVVPDSVYRVQVNDQIIEVDGKSLVGVTQAYAASVLRNTSGHVKYVTVFFLTKI